MIEPLFVPLVVFCCYLIREAWLALYPVLGFMASIYFSSCVFVTVVEGLLWHISIMLSPLPVSTTSITSSVLITGGFAFCDLGRL